MITITRAVLRQFYPEEEILQQYTRYNTAMRALTYGRYFHGSGSNLDDVRFFRGPGRANLAGCHTDHQLGDVLPIALSDDTIIAARWTQTGKIRAYDTGIREYREIDLNQSLEAKAEEKGDWISMLRGATHLLFKAYRGAINKTMGIDMVLNGRVGVGSGKSSSASVEVVVGKTIDGMYDFKTDPVQLAKYMRAVENNYYGKPCGQMDQMISACGKEGYALHMHFTRGDPVIKEINISELTNQGYKIVIVESGESHKGLDKYYRAITDDMHQGAMILSGKRNDDLVLGDISVQLYKANRQKLPDNTTIKTRTEYWFEEQERVKLIAKAFSEGRIEDAGELWNKRAYGARYKLQNTHIPGRQRDGKGGQEILLDLSNKTNLSIGNANFGGGFGGPTSHLVKSENVDAFIDYMLKNANKKGLTDAKAKAYTPARGACDVIFN